MAEHPVVVGYRNADSAGAVALAARLAALLDEPLLVVSAYRYEPVALTPGVIPRSSNDARFDMAQEQLTRARALVPDGIAVREDVIPAQGMTTALADRAREADACALVVGRDVDHHVARTLLERAPCPLAVAPRAIAGLGTIGVAWDGSPGARCALEAAAQLAIRSRARVQILSVGSGADPGAAVARLPAAVAGAVVALRGDPGARLVEASAGLDLLVCGTHGRGRILGAVLGSVSARLLAAAECPVVVAPPRARARPGAPLGLTTAARQAI